MEVPEPMEFQDPLDRHVTVAFGPEAVGVVVKDRLEERTEEEANHLLSNAIADGGDAQRTGVAVAFGDVDATQGQGLVGPVLEASHQGQQVLFEIAREQLDADLVDSGRSSVAFDVPKSDPHQFRSDPSRQRVRLDLGHLAGPFLLNSWDAERTIRTPATPWRMFLRAGTPSE